MEYLQQGMGYFGPKFWLEIVRVIIIIIKRNAVTIVCHLSTLHECERQTDRLTTKR